MNLPFFKNSVLLKWKVPKDWNKAANGLDAINWGKGLKFILFFSIFFILYYFLFSEKEVNISLVIILSITFSTFLYFIQRFTRWASWPSARIYKKTILVSYWEGTDEVDIENVDSYRFKRRNINKTQIPVLELKLNNGSYFELGVPNSDVEKAIKRVLSSRLNIPYLGSRNA